MTRAELDGVEASIPSIAECHAWARTEDEALLKLLERVSFFFNLPNPFKHELDRSRREGGATFYTLIIKQ